MKPAPSTVSNSARSCAQEAVAWYLGQIDPLEPHAVNVRRFLRGPVVVLTANMLNAPFETGNESTRHPFTASKDAEENGQEKPKKDIPHVQVGETQETSQANWRDYLNKGDKSACYLQELFSSEVIKEKYTSLSRRAKARLDAFLEGVALAVVSEGGEPEKSAARRTTSSDSIDFSLIEGLVGFRSMEARTSKTPVRDVPTLKKIVRSNTANKARRCPQMAEAALVTRLELYLRCLHRVAAHCNDCVIAQEPAKALKARARFVVEAFVANVGTVRQVSPILTRLLTVLTKELLAMGTLSEELQLVIRNIVSVYVHATSFASLAFLSSPETSADQRLTPAILKYLLYLQNNWKNCEADCDLELMLSTVLDPKMRHIFKTSEFQSIGHLLEVYQSFRGELQYIELPPSDRRIDEDQVSQALKDLQREVIAVNGSVLPHVTNRTDLMQLLASALNTRTVFEGSRRRGKKTKTRGKASQFTIVEGRDVPVSYSGNEADLSESSDYSESSIEENNAIPTVTQRTTRRRSRFRLSTVDLLTKRLLLAAGRTGTGGDAYFVVRDLFGGDDVEVVPSKHQPGSVRPATIDLLVRLASVTIKCHASFDVYPKSMVGDCEPLIQIHTTTTEIIALQEVRAADRQQPESVGDAAEGMCETVLQEHPTEQGRPRILSVRPAVYEKVSVWHTPS